MTLVQLRHFIRWRSYRSRVEAHLYAAGAEPQHPGAPEEELGQPLFGRGPA